MGYTIQRGYAGGGGVEEFLDAIGIDTQATNRVIVPGRSTGNATPAAVVIQSTVPGASGEDLQTLQDTLYIVNNRIGIRVVPSSAVFEIGGSLLNENGLNIFPTATNTNTRLLQLKITDALATYISLIDENGNSNLAIRNKAIVHNGLVITNNANGDWGLKVSPGFASDVGTIIQGADGQVADLMQWKDFAEVVGWRIGASPNLLGGRVASSTNVAAGVVYIAAPVSTGNAVPGSVIIQSTAPDVSGSAQQTLSDTLIVKNRKVGVGITPTTYDLETAHIGGYPADVVRFAGPGDLDALKVQIIAGVGTVWETAPGYGALKIRAPAIYFQNNAGDTNFFVNTSEFWSDHLITNYIALGTSPINSPGGTWLLSGATSPRFAIQTETFLLTTESPQWVATPPNASFEVRNGLASRVVAIFKGADGQLADVAQFKGGKVKIEGIGQTVLDVGRTGAESNQRLFEVIADAAYPNSGWVRILGGLIFESSGDANLWISTNVGYKTWRMLAGTHLTFNSTTYLGWDSTTQYTIGDADVRLNPVSAGTLKLTSNGTLLGKFIADAFVGMNGSGTNVVGTNVTIAPGRSTGNAAPASVVIQSTIADVSGSALQNLINTLYVANGRVGIRTANPSGTLGVDGDFYLSQAFVQTGGYIQQSFDNAIWYAGTSGAGYNWYLKSHDGTAWRNVIHTLSGNIVFGEVATQSLVFNGDANFAQLAGTQANFGVYPVNLGNSGSAYSGVGYNVDFQVDGTYKYKASDTAFFIHMGGISGNAIDFRTGLLGVVGANIDWSTTMSLYNTGDVAIGFGQSAVVPAARLHIRKSQAGLNTLGNSRVLILDNISGGNGELQEIGLGYKGAATYQPVVIGHRVTDSTDFTKGDFYIAMRNSGNDVAPTERFTISAAGVVTISHGLLTLGNAVSQGRLNLGTAGVNIQNSSGTCYVIAPGVVYMSGNGGANYLYLSGTQLDPNNNDHFNLGQSSLRWKSLWLSGKITGTEFGGTDGSGTNVVGTNATIAPGRSTGNAIPAAVILRSTVADVSGSSLQVLQDTLIVKNGYISVRQANGTPDVHECQISHDGTNVIITNKSNAHINFVTNTRTWQFYNNGSTIVPGDILASGSILASTIGSGGSLQLWNTAILKSGAGASMDVGLYRAAAGVWEINDGTAGQLRDIVGRHISFNGSQIDFSGLPTSDPVVAGRLWNDAGTVKISAG